MYVFGVGRGMTFVLLNMPHNFVCTKKQTICAAEAST